MVGLEGTLEPCQPPCCGLGAPHPPSMALGTSRDGAPVLLWTSFGVCWSPNQREDKRIGELVQLVFTLSS